VADANKFLAKMLERLYASLTAGPALNCRPHSSRQRVDLAVLSKLDGSSPGQILAGLLGPSGSVRLTARIPAPPPDEDESASPEARDELRAQRKRWDEQQALLTKLRTIAEDALTFEQDTGAHVLHVGLPLLRVPLELARAKSGTRQLLAPLAFIPVRLVIKKGRSTTVELSCAGEGIDRVEPNAALFAWLERNTRTKLREELFDDPTGEQPWKEIDEIVAAVAKALELSPPSPFTPDSDWAATPRSDEARGPDAVVLPSAVLGLYPLANQSLVHDMEALCEGGELQGPIEGFLRADAGVVSKESPAPPSAGEPRDFSTERLVASADPCQARAVALARRSRGLVIHGPPGTGKSQTIANIIGDHLAHGERVLFVCDKRTALDVVQNRLEHLGLGSLCAVVHDARRDQRDLYMGIRAQLDALPEAPTDATALEELAAVDRQLRSVHEELSRSLAATGGKPDGAPSFHELVGTWLGLDVPAPLARAAAALESLRPSEAASHETTVREVLQRALKDGFPDNPWRSAAGIDLPSYLGAPILRWREKMDELERFTQAADATASPDILPFGPGELGPQGEARAALGEQLGRIFQWAEPASIARWSVAEPAAVQAAQAELDALAPQSDVLHRAPLDAELAVVQRSNPMPLALLGLTMAALTAWIPLARKWFRFLFFLRRMRAAKVLAQFGVAFSAEAVERVATFLEGVRARILLGDWYRRMLQPVGASQSQELVPDATLSKARSDHQALFAALRDIDTNPALAPCAAAVRKAMADPAGRTRLVEGLRRSAARANAVAALEAAVETNPLLSERFRRETSRGLREGKTWGELVSHLSRRLGSLESILRIDAALKAMPPELSRATSTLADRSAEPELGWNAIRKAAIEVELRARIAAEPALANIDGERLSALYQSYRTLAIRKTELVRKSILHLWAARQRERLLAGTGSRLNSAGAELRRRLMLRGERAMKVRQVIAAGAGTEGGDPLFDVKPVWMASPDTVAQIFPREPLFDVLVFDEASQCRLEEALPMLLRAKRVVIAGDPKQLPPTRFFESAVASSPEDEVETEQQLFEEQQSDVEDLLGAALNLEIEQSYLDVHYRSRHEELIAFSNEHFYESRLQAIPGHPSRRAVTAPLRLLPVNGVYEKRVNEAEAAAVVGLVKELLAVAESPSIGIACMNLSQRDAIVESLEQAAAEDSAFAAKLAVARQRRGAGSFEGLFVKNLENVQGDERDHLIISTTYGPDPKGRFYRRFGPLGQAGGGRRLNVLVTRAREQIHLVTSIPREVYLSPPELAPGQTPNGAWLLFAYLRFAEELGTAAAGAQTQPTDAGVREPVVRVWPSERGSRFSEVLARKLAAQQGLSSEVHWGNDGFCVDLALQGTESAEPLGVLCDGTRFDKGSDPVEWDVFRSEVLASQGWKLHRLWTPQFFRDAEEQVARIVRELQAASAGRETKSRAG